MAPHFRVSAAFLLLAFEAFLHLAHVTPFARASPNRFLLAATNAKFTSSGSNYRVSLGRVNVTRATSQFAVSNAGTAPKLKYYGGPLIRNVQVVPIFYGAALYQQELQNWYSVVVNSTHMDLLAEYSVNNYTLGRGVANASYAITSNLKSTVDDELDIKPMLRSLVQQGILTPNENAYYPIHFAPSTTITQKGDASCVSFCGYHGTINIADISNTTYLYYGVVADQTGACFGGCGVSVNPLYNAESVAAHELMEAITDPCVGVASSVGFPLGWYDTANGEIGDICNAQQVTMYLPSGTYVVQKEWSNVQNSCVAYALGTTPPTTTVLPSTTCHDVCATGSPLDPSCSTVASCVVKLDKYCGATWWDSACVYEANTKCSAGCSAVASSSTTSTSPATATATPPPLVCHDVCVSGSPMRPGCSDIAACVTKFDSYCQNTKWDSVCVSEAQSKCGAKCSTSSKSSSASASSTSSTPKPSTASPSTVSTSSSIPISPPASTSLSPSTVPSSTIASSLPAPSGSLSSSVTSPLVVTSASTLSIATLSSSIISTFAQSTSITPSQTPPTSSSQSTPASQSSSSSPASSASQSVSSSVPSSPSVAPIVTSTLPPYSPSSSPSAVTTTSSAVASLSPTVQPPSSSSAPSSVPVGPSQTSSTSSLAVVSTPPSTVPSSPTPSSSDQQQTSPLASSSAIAPTSIDSSQPSPTSSLDSSSASTIDSSSSATSPSSSPTAVPSPPVSTCRDVCTTGDPVPPSCGSVASCVATLKPSCAEAVWDAKCIILASGCGAVCDGTGKSTAPAVNGTTYTATILTASTKTLTTTTLVTVTVLPPAATSTKLTTTTAIKLSTTTKTTVKTVTATPASPSPSPAVKTVTVSVTAPAPPGKTVTVTATAKSTAPGKTVTVTVGPPPPATKTVTVTGPGKTVTATGKGGTVTVYKSV
ncbi:hypothetical protein DFJ73DRAFT_796127 [Zopfochytrium polystomum]|nr:hypothetical protein DFJ73DRAFT_796127 [Zopfochytrium polystomum]